MQINQIVKSLLSALLVATLSLTAKADDLPKRETPIPKTTNGVPHIQIGVKPVPELSEELLRRVSSISGIEIRDTIVSLPGALGFWIVEDVPLARSDVIVRGREFAHVHPDGSLHASLSPTLADRAVKAGWAIHHPWADQRPGWDGFVMIYTPSSFKEMEVVFDLVVKSFEFVTGSKATLEK